MDLEDFETEESEEALDAAKRRGKKAPAKQPKQTKEKVLETYHFFYDKRSDLVSSSSDARGSEISQLTKSPSSAHPTMIPTAIDSPA